MICKKLTINNQTYLFSCYLLNLQAFIGIVLAVLFHAVGVSQKSIGVLMGGILFFVWMWQGRFDNFQLSIVNCQLSCMMYLCMMYESEVTCLKYKVCVKVNVKVVFFLVSAFSLLFLYKPFGRMVSMAVGDAGDIETGGEVAHINCIFR